MYMYYGDPKGNYYVIRLVNPWHMRRRAISILFSLCVYLSVTVLASYILYTCFVCSGSEVS